MNFKKLSDEEYNEALEVLDYFLSMGVGEILNK